VLDNPGLRDQVSVVIHFEPFRALVAQAMGEVRTYFARNLPHAWSSLGAHARTLVRAPPPVCICLVDRRNGPRTAPDPVCSYADVTWPTDIETLLHAFHGPMLAIAYHKPDASEVPFLLGQEVRTRAPLTPRPGRVEAAAAAAAAAEAAAAACADVDESIEDELYDSLAEMAITSPGELIARMAEWRRHREASRKKERTAAAAAAADVMTRVHDYITPAQFDALAFLVDETRCGGGGGGARDVTPTISDVLRGVQHYGGFGITPDALNDMFRLLRDHRAGAVTKLARYAQVVELTRRAPHASNVLRIVAELLRKRDERRAYVVGPLPVEAKEAQIRALERKWGTPAGSGAFEATSARFYYCDVCNWVYTNVRGLKSPFFRFGMRDVSCDYETLEVYCRAKPARVNHRGKCGDTPLRYINLIGIRLAFGRIVVQLCVGCRSD
jgi:hypothetical protein